MTFDAEMEKHAETLRSFATALEKNGHHITGASFSDVAAAIRALFADWKQRGELIDIQYRVNEDMTKVVQEAEAERDRLRDENRELTADKDLQSGVIAKLIIEEREKEADRDRLHAQMYSSQPYYYDYWKKELAENERLREEVKRTQERCESHRVERKARIMELEKENERLTSKVDDLEATIDRADEHTAGLMQKIEAAERVIKRLNTLASQALELHTPLQPWWNEPYQRCRMDTLEWPCPTVRALRGEE